MAPKEHWKGCIQAGWELSGAFLVLVAPAWSVSPLAPPWVAKPQECWGGAWGGFPGNACAGEAPACLCALFGTLGTLECWHEEPWAQGSGASEPQQCQGWQEAAEGISLLGSQRGSGAPVERTGECQSRRCHRSWEVAKLVLSDAPKPSGCRNTDRGSLRPRSAGRRLINTRALIIKWLIVLAGPIEAAIYGAANSHGRGKTLRAGGEAAATWIQRESAAIGS